MNYDGEGSYVVNIPVCCDCSLQASYTVMEMKDKIHPFFTNYVTFYFKCRFEIVGYGCSTCVGNTAPLSEAVLNAVKQVNCVDQ